MASHIELGRAGEAAAAAFYRRRGYRILDRNFVARGGEIDLVCRRGRVVVFCEVKTRTSARWGVPSEAVGAVKQRRIRRAAAQWLARQPRRKGELRFDVVSVAGTERGLELTHLPGAF